MREFPELIVVISKYPAFLVNLVKTILACEIYLLNDLII